jgi:hypothetical protein
MIAAPYPQYIFNSKYDGRYDVEIIKKGFILVMDGVYGF